MCRGAAAGSHVLTHPGHGRGARAAGGQKGGREGSALRPQAAAGRAGAGLGQGKVRSSSQPPGEPQPACAVWGSLRRQRGESIAQSKAGLERPVERLLG